MAKLSKRAQLEQLGWKFTAIPRFFEAGALCHDSRTGYKSPAYYDYKHPEAWQVTPPEGSSCSPRRFDNSSTIPAVCWAWKQTMAPKLKAELTGVAALVALMGDARSSGLVADGVDDTSMMPVRPDAKLFSLCREVAACDRLADDLRQGDGSNPWTERAAFRREVDQLHEAQRTKDRLVKEIVELKATTVFGAVAKARVIGTLFENSSGLRAVAVRSLVADLVAAIGPGSASLGAGL